MYVPFSGVGVGFSRMHTTLKTLAKEIEDSCSMSFDIFMQWIISSMLMVLSRVYLSSTLIVVFFWFFFCFFFI